ncbi:hypothetical protein [Curtobacterium sp. RRHDQ10]
MSDRERTPDRVAAVMGGAAALVAIVVVIVWSLATQTPAVVT